MRYHMEWKLKIIKGEKVTKGMKMVRYISTAGKTGSYIG